LIFKYKVAFLLDKNNNWFFKYLKKARLDKKKYNFKFFIDYHKIQKHDIVMILSYTKILPSKFLNKNRLNVVIHSSKLPNDKGFAPLSYQILRGKNKNI
jgi:methionyl-tRNA formyltransferase